MTHTLDMDLLAVSAQLGPRIAEQSAIGESRTVGRRRPWQVSRSHGNVGPDGTTYL